MSVEAPVSNSETISSGTALAGSFEPPKRPASSILQQAYQCVCVAALALTSYFVISHFFLQSVRVVGSSMLPTLQDSQHYLLNRWVYYVRPPQRTDVVVIRDPVDRGFSVKRIIGVAGDSVYLKDGKVYVNGCQLAEPYLGADTATFTYSAFRDELIFCGKDQYFLLGDNRKNSVDSRTYGPVPRQDIVGLIVR
jgi:signal peptidase I